MLGVLLHLAEPLQENKNNNNSPLKMSKMTIAQLGMVLFVLCLSTQVVSQNTTTETASTNSTYNHTATTPGILSSPTNSTSSTGAAVSLNAGGLTVLTPVLMAAFLLTPYC